MRYTSRERSGRLLLGAQSREELQTDPEDDGDEAGREEQRCNGTCRVCTPIWTWMGTEARPPPSLHHREKRDHHWITAGACQRHQGMEEEESRRRGADGMSHHCVDAT